MKDKNGPYGQYPEPFKLSTPKNSTSKVIVDDFIKKQEQSNLIILEEFKHANNRGQSMQLFDYHQNSSSQLPRHVKNAHSTVSRGDENGSQTTNTSIDTMTL